MPPLPPGVKKIVSPKGKTVYLARFAARDPDGFRVYPEKRFPTAKQASEWRTEQLALYDKGIAVAPTELTVKQAIADWLAGRRIKPTTLAAYTAALQPVVEQYGTRRVQTITKRDVEKLITALQEGTTPHGVWARTSINPLLARWKGVWRDLLAQGVIPRDVVSLVEPLRKRDDKGDASKGVLHLDDVLNAEEIETVLTAHGDSGPRTEGDTKGGERAPYALARRRELFLHLALLGLRRGELAGLRWSSVVRETTPPRLIISATRVVARGKVIDQRDGKSAASKREVLLPPHVVDIITRVQREQAEYKRQRGKKWRGPDDQWLIAHPNGKPVQPGTLDTWWTAALAHAGVPHRRLHASRHTAATAMILGGVPAAKVAAWLGHSDGGVLALRTYAHVRADDLADVLDVFARPAVKPEEGDAAS